jgi:hypothetical protein
MSANKNTNASAEASSTSANNNARAQTNPANPDSAITLVALSQDGGVANLATILIPEEDSSSKAKKTTLSTEEKSSLERCEQVIERGLATFIEVGAAMYEIQSQRLYRQEHGSFEAYLSSRWSFKRAHAYRLINAYRVLETIRDEDGKELTESHARQLARLPQDQRTEALRRAKELAGEKSRTAKHIQQAVDAMLGKTKKPSASASAPAEDDGEDNDDSGGQTNEKTPTPPSPTGGATIPSEPSQTPMTVDTELVEELLALVRETRELLTEDQDVAAAIRHLFRMEHLLDSSAAKKRYGSLEVQAVNAGSPQEDTYKEVVHPMAQLQAA